MEFVHYKEPVQFCIIKNYYTKNEVEAIYKELENTRLDGPENTFSARSIDGDFLKSNKGAFIKTEDGPIFHLSKKLFREVSWELKKHHWFWEYFNLKLEDTILVTRYDTGDYYKSHRDECVFTAIYYTWKEPKSFTGGDLYFGDFKVPIENNSLLVFPGPTFHEVTPVVGSGRWAISQFVRLGKSHAPKKDMYHYHNFLHATAYKRVQDLMFKSREWFLGNSSVELYPRFWKLPLDNNEYVKSLINSVLEEHDLQILRVYANGQFYGQNGSFHQDDTRPGTWTFLLYLNDIEQDAIDEWHGTTEFKTENGIISQQPEPNLGVLFKSDLFHRGLGPSKFVTDMRVTLAWKLEKRVGHRR